MIQVILVDDHKLILEGISHMLKEADTINIKGIFTSPLEALEYINQNEVDIVVTDLDMPEMNGIHLIKAIRKVNKDQKIIVLSMIDEQSIINRMIKYDVNGYLMKNDAQNELLLAIKQVNEGIIYYNKEVRAKLFQNMKALNKPKNNSIPRLSVREKEILKLIIGENTAKEIASLLFISEGTVITHRKHIMSKLGAKNTAGIVRIGMELGLV